MGVVFHARDEQDGGDVAVKLLSGASPDDARRFLREGKILAALDHPSIVRYVAHGQSADGQLYLVMEWLEGEDLAHRLARGPLSVEDTIVLGARVADALSGAHAEGIVHRDVKPSNILICDWDRRDVRVVDFGIARGAFTSHALTRSGALLGTPSYMAPEQASSAPVGPFTDLFALGCVLFECLTGTPAFSGDTVMAVLAKVLFADAPAVSALRHGVPPALEEIITGLLAKDPERRPEDATRVASGLRSIGSEQTPVAPASRTIGELERRVVSVVVGASPLSATADTELSAPDDPLASLDPGSGAQVRVLPDGSVVSLFRGAVAADEAVKAVRYALRLRGMRPELAFAVTTGRAVTGASLPAGDAIDRAVDLVGGAASGLVLLDEATAELVAEQVHVVEGEGGREARMVCSESGGSQRLVLGKRTSFVGRRRELAFLRATLEDCEEHGVARAVLVTAPAGLGKSRLRRELLSGLQDGPWLGRAWVARADGSVEPGPLELIASLVRSAAEGSPASGAPDQPDLVAHLAEILGSEQRDLVSTFLAELAGFEPPVGSHPGLAAARADPTLMAAQVTSALDAWLGAETRLGPVLLVLEDIHWADAESMEVVDRWLSQLCERPLMVVGLARPELWERFGELWRSHDVSEIKLPPLGRRACERLVRQVVSEVDVSDLGELVGACEGNPLLLEELLRARAAGATARPQLAALIETRLAKLPSEHRRVLRAASIIGERFSVEGLARIAQAGAEMVERVLEGAASEELLVRSAGGMGELDGIWAFRHAVVRDVAYAMLPADDRTAGHRAVADWLRERGGTHDLAAVADHLERAATDDAERLEAVRAWITAVEQSDVVGAMRMLPRARGLLDQSDESSSRDRIELKLLEHEFVVLSRVDHDATRRLVERWLELARRLDALADLAEALSSCATVDARAGKLEKAREAIQEADAIAGGLESSRRRASVAKAAGIVAYYEGDLEGALERWLAALPWAQEASAGREITVTTHNIADIQMRLGRTDDARRYLERSEWARGVHGIGSTLGFETSNRRLRLFLEVLEGDRAALAEIEELAELEEGRQNRWNQLESLLFLGLARGWAGDDAAARFTLEKLESLSAELGHHRLADEARQAMDALDRGERPWFRGGVRPA